MADARPLAREALAGPTLDAARALLGALLVREDVRGVRSGRIVEVEAYIGVEDRASHARFGLTPRNAVMFGPPGVAYVYLVYGMYHCLNVVTEPEGRPAAVLVRAIAPVEGLELMRADRLTARAGTTDRLAAEERRLARLPAAALARGPGLVCAALGLDRSWSGIDMCDPASRLRLEVEEGRDAPTIVESPRVGIGYAGEPWTSHPWRLAIAGDPAVSGGPARPVGPVRPIRSAGRRPDATSC